MTIHIKYLGMIADHTDKTSEDFVIANKSTVLDLNTLLLDKYPGLNQMTYKIAVNHQLSTNEKNLQDGDEVALLPPFAGG